MSGRSLWRRGLRIRATDADFEFPRKLMMLTRVRYKACREDLRVVQWFLCEMLGRKPRWRLPGNGMRNYDWWVRAIKISDLPGNCFAELLQQSFRFICKGKRANLPAWHGAALRFYMLKKIWFWSQRKEGALDIGIGISHAQIMSMSRKGVYVTCIKSKQNSFLKSCCVSEM